MNHLTPLGDDKEKEKKPGLTMPGWTGGKMGIGAGGWGGGDKEKKKAHVVTTSPVAGGDASLKEVREGLGTLQRMSDKELQSLLETVPSDVILFLRSISTTVDEKCVF